MARFAFLLLGAAMPGLAQTTVSSRLLDWKGAPVVGAEVTLRNRSLTTRTDLQGRFSFNLDPVKVKSGAPAMRGPVTEFGSGWYDFLGRRQRGSSASASPPVALAKASVGAADLDLLIQARGFDDRAILVKEPARLDSLIRLEGRGISIKAPLAPAACSLGQTVRFFAVHRDSTRRMRIELDSTGEGMWFRPAAPACFVETRFQDTCRFTVPAKLAIPLAGGKADTLRVPGQRLHFRVVEIGADSILARGPQPLTIHKKAAPEIHVVLEPATVSVNDTVFAKAAIRDPLNENLKLFWQTAAGRFPNVGGKAVFTAPGAAGFLIVGFVAVRPDGTEYSQSAETKVVWDYPIIDPVSSILAPVRQNVEFHLSVQNEFGIIRHYDVDVGKTGSWKRIDGADGCCVLDAPTEAGQYFKVAVRVTDDDGFTDEDSVTVQTTYPVLPIAGGELRDVVPLSASRSLFAGTIGGKVLVGSMDSLGILAWHREWSVHQATHPNDPRSIRLVTNRDGGATILTRSGTESTTDFHLLRIDVNGGDSLGEQSFRLEHWAEPRFLLQASNGDYLISYAGKGGGLARTDSKGTLRWKRNYASFESINHILPLANGSLLLTGEGPSHIAGGVRHGRGALAEVTSAGDTVWTRNYGMIGHEFQRAFPAAGGYRIFSRKGAVVDWTYIPSSGIWSMRTDAKGALLDSAFVPHPYPLHPTDAIRTRDGGTLVMAETAIDGPPDVIFAKLNASGALVWKQAYGRVAAATLHAVHEASDGGFMAAGWAAVTWGHHNPMVMPLKADGRSR